jgi:hypothetical protein
MACGAIFDSLSPSRLAAEARSFDLPEKREQSSGVILKNTIMPKQACQEIVDSPVDGLGLDPAPSPLSETPGDLINRIPYNGLKKVLSAPSPRRRGEGEAHQRRRERVAIRPPRAARDRAPTRRWPRPAITARRSASLIAVQAAISAVVRPQPTHMSDSGSRTQTLTQGVEIDADMGPDLSGGMADEKSAPGGDLGALLGGAGDIAGLAADRAPRQGDHAQGGGAAHERRDERVDEAERHKA